MKTNTLLASMPECCAARVLEEVHPGAEWACFTCGRRWSWRFNSQGPCASWRWWWQRDNAREMADCGVLEEELLASVYAEADAVRAKNLPRFDDDTTTCPVCGNDAASSRGSFTSTFHCYGCWTTWTPAEELERLHVLRATGLVTKGKGKEPLQ